MKNGRCIIDDDIVNECIVKMSAADAIILGSPTYFGDINPEIKALIDRAGLVSRANGDLFSRKVGAAVIAVRRTGGLHAFDSINHFFLINDMMVPGSSYWNMSLSGDIGDFDNDVEGKATMKKLAENISWLVEKIKT
jgi:multimeric flavodoxin WrbA